MRAKCYGCRRTSRPQSAFAAQGRIKIRLSGSGHCSDLAAIHGCMASLFKVWVLSHLQAVLTDESGQDTSEYAVLIGLVALALITTVMLLGETITSVFAGIGSSLTVQ